MALRFLDSFDHYASADLTAKWSSTSGTAPTVVAAAGRRSTAALRFIGTAAARVTKNLDSQATWVVGFALNAAGNPTFAARALVQLIDTGTIHVALQVNTDGSFSVLRGSTTLATAGSLPLGSYCYIELKATISDTGSYEVRLNGATIMAASGVDTRNGANASANTITFGSPVSGPGGGNYDIDDVYICDGSSSGSPSVNVDFLGDVRVDAYLPNGNGNSSQFVGSDADSTDNYLLVDDSAPDGDSTYVESSTATEKDTYAFANISHTPASIFGVQINMTARKDDAGARSIASVVRSGGADTDGTSQALSTSFIDYLQIVEQDPNTAAAWTATNFNAAEFGHKVAV